MAIVKRIKHITWYVFLALFSLFPIRNNKVLLSNYNGKGYGDNSKYITEHLLKFSNINLIWVVKNQSEANSLPKGVEYCLVDSLAHRYHMATAKVWVDNKRKKMLKKRKNQKYLQTWHGFALKRIEKDAGNSLSNSYIKSAIRDSKNIDLIVSDSAFMTNLYKNSFWYNGEVVEWGSPRNDIIFTDSDDIKLRVKEYFSIPEEKGIILYAPTFRANLGLESYLKDFNEIIKGCSEKFGKDFVVVVRLHPNISDKSEELGLDGKIVHNGSFYPDMQELLSASDVLITDYSSVMFDFSLTNKPCFLYASDIEDYKNDRNFYFEIDKLPFPLCTDIKRLNKEILAFDKKVYDQRINEFFDSVGMIRSGNASEKCADLILKWCK